MMLQSQPTSGMMVPPPAPQPAQVITQPNVYPTATHQNPKVLENYSKKSARNLATATIIASVLFTIFGICAIILGEYQKYFTDIGSPIWSGLLYLLTGLLGVSSAHTCLRSKIVSFMIMSIISSVIGCAPIINYALFLSYERTLNCRNWYYDYYAHDDDEIFKMCQDTSDARLAIYSVIVILSVILPILSIISSALCGQVLCCGNSAQRITTVIYYPQPGVVIQPQNAAMFPQYGVPPPNTQNLGNPNSYSMEYAKPPPPYGDAGFPATQL